jgi:V/A-type H+/Na+-transporting ATPase subunit A
MPVNGSVIRVAGPVVEAKGMAQAVMHEPVEVGKDQLIGEIIRLDGERATIKVYQNTTGLKLNARFCPCTTSAGCDFRFL